MGTLSTKYLRRTNAGLMYDAYSLKSSDGARDKDQIVALNDDGKIDQTMVGQVLVDIAVPASIWTVTHNLKRYPQVTCVDSSGAEIVGDLTYVSDLVLTVTFGADCSGKVYLN